MPDTLPMSYYITDEPVSSQTIYLPEDLPILDNPPSTEQEWEDVLQQYAVDRDIEDYGQPLSLEDLGKRRLVPRRGLEGSDVSDDEPDVQGCSLSAKRKQSLGIAGSIGPPPLPSEDPDMRSSQAERRRMREHYEAEGWLPGPQPGHRLKIRRKRTIRRLGLAGNPDDDPERRAIMAQYASLAQQMFNATAAGICIIRDDLEYKYATNPDAEPLVVLSRDTPFGLTIASQHETCVAVGDISKDWRLRGHPVLLQKGMKFTASAPLRYLRRHPPVTFGSLSIWGSEARQKFTEREQDMLLKLANMLVYQLATLQSEILAERSSLMHEKSLAFWRRSVMPPSVAQELGAKSAKPKASKTKRKKQKVEKVERSASPAPSVESTPELVTKSGPRESKDLKREEQESDAGLYRDAAVTLREILGADSVAFVKMDDFQLYFRRSDSLEPDMASTNFNRTNPVFGFLTGAPWPEHFEPVVNHVPGPDSDLVTVLGSAGDGEHRFLKSGTERTLAKFLATFLKTRRFWWDKSDSEDELAHDLINCMPAETQTLLVHGFFTGDGRARLAAFAGWNRPPSSFAYTSTITLPFIHVLSAITIGVKSMRKQRTLEQSQISYSNLQAHELRTPLHQILAITQLLRSAMIDLAEAPQDCSSYQNSVQQIRDLLPILDAIDTSGKTLHGIVDNILSFLDLKARDFAPGDSTTPRMFDSPAGGPRSLIAMFEEVINDACEESERTRRAALQPLNSIETIFEFPPDLEDTMEDSGGALRKAVSKILSNAYKFIEAEGFVKIAIKNLPGPDGCQEMCRTKRISIEITDNGVGMNEAFVQDHLGEPWAKQDPFTTGSGLSVHLAYRIIDLMGGRMDISSAPGRGAIVSIEVPVMRKSPIVPQTPPPDFMQSPNPQKRKLAFVGFNRPEKRVAGLPMLGEVLLRQYSALGIDICGVQDADLIIANGDVEEMPEGKLLMQNAKADEIIFLTSPGHEPLEEVVKAAHANGKLVRRFAKPVTPSVVRHTLRRHHINFPGLHSIPSSPDINRRVSLKSGAAVNGTRTPDSDSVTSGRAKKIEVETVGKKSGFLAGMANMWKPKGMCPEEAIACLSLGDYFSSRRRGTLDRTPSISSSMQESSQDASTPPTSHTGALDTPPAPSEEAIVASGDEEPDPIKVLVVEDNMINRKILVRILSTKLPIEILEAADGVEAVEVFKSLTSPCIVLLDINMPRMDGFQACEKFRAIEKQDPSRGNARVIAVTALSGEEDKRRGLKEVGFNLWLVKPCGKQTITNTVESARKELLGIEEEFESDDEPVLPRRHTA